MAHYEGKRYGCSCPDGTCDMNCRMYRIAAGKPSNADRIRAMTDGELAHLLHSAEEHLFTGNLWNYEKWTEWLKQEVSE